MKRIFILLSLLLPFMTMAAPNYQSGKINNLTVVTSGIMIKMDKGLPDNCAGTPYGWMLIKQEYKAITSVVLTIWASGNKAGTVYTSGRQDGVGYCLVSQFDPAG